VIAIITWLLSPCSKMCFYVLICLYSALFFPCICVCHITKLYFLSCQ